MSDNSVDTEEATTSPPTSLNGVENAPEGTPSMATSVSPAPTGTLDSRTNEADGETLPLKRDKHPKYYKRKKMAEAFVFIGGIVVLWTLLAAAVVVYHIPTGSSDAAGNIDTSSCSAEVYTGAVCLDALTFWQNCIPDRANSTDVFIVNQPEMTQEEIESEFTTFQGMFSLVSPSQACLMQAVPFFCLMNFGLCGNDSTPYLPTSGQCEALAVACAAEFQVISAMLPELIPDCDALPDTGIDCSAQTIPTTNMSIPGPSTPGPNTAPPTLNCSNGFFFDDAAGFCVPECGKWEELPHGTVVAFDVIVGLQAAIYIIVTIVALVCAVIRHERMFKFPSILLVYALIPFGIFEVILLISFTDRTELFCNTRSLLDNTDPTHFCNFSGVAFYYLTLQQGILWLCHIITVFWGVMFPFHFRRWEKKRYFRFVHAGMLAVVLLLPIIPVIAAVSTGGFTLPRFPPNTCLATDRNATFYGFVLLAIIILGAGICLVALVLWRLSYLLKGRKLQRRNTDMELRARRRVQSKVLVIVIYFFLFLLESQVAFTFALREAPDFRDGLMRYFRCEALGVTMMCDPRKYFDRTAGQAAVVVGYVILGFYPAMNLMFFVDVKEIKRKVRMWLKMPVEDVGMNSISLARQRSAEREPSSHHNAQK